MDGVDRAVALLVSDELEEYIGGEGKKGDDDENNTSGEYSTASHDMRLSAAGLVDDEHCPFRRLIVEDEAEGVLLAWAEFWDVPAMARYLGDMTLDSGGRRVCHSVRLVGIGWTRRRTKGGSDTGRLWWCGDSVRVGGNGAKGTAMGGGHGCC